MPTVRTPIPKTLEYRRVRERWASQRLSKLRQEYDAGPSRFSAPDRGRREGRRNWAKLVAWERHGDEVWGADKVEREGMGEYRVEYTSGRTGEAFHIGNEALEVRGVAKALNSLTEPFMRMVVDAVDIEAAAAAFDIYRQWPTYSGQSKAALALAWGKASNGVEVRFVSGAEYTFRNASTAKAWAYARRRWSQVAAKSGARVRVGQMKTNRI
jgi:hypothetical protein